VIKFTPRRREVPSAECVELRLGADCSLEMTVPDPAGNVAESSDSRSYPSQTDLTPVGCTTVGYLARRLDGGIMSLNLSDDARNVMVDAWAKTMDGGSIEILSDTQRVLAELLLSSPAGAPAGRRRTRAQSDHRGTRRAGHRDCHGRARPHADRRRGSFLRRWR